MIKDMVGEMGKEPNEIALDYPIATIRLAFDVLAHDSSIDNFSLEELVALADIFNYLDVPSPKLDSVTNKIKLLSEVSSVKITENKALQELHPDVQKSFMVDSAVSYLKNILMSKYEKDRKKVLASSYGTVLSVELIFDGKKIISGHHNFTNNLIMWDISNLSNITHQSLVGHPWTVYSVACSSDGKSLVAGGEGSQNFIVWNLWTDQEAFLLNDIKNYNVDRVRLIYQLCLEASYVKVIKLKKDTAEYKLFFDLPMDMQQLLKSALPIKVAREKSIGKAFYKKNSYALQKTQKKRPQGPLFLCFL